MKEKRFRKGQGLPVNVIILATLALIVLFVLISIFGKGSSRSIDTLESCAARRGECKLVGEGCDTTELKLSNVKCPESRVCCVKILEK